MPRIRESQTPWRQSWRAQRAVMRAARGISSRRGVMYAHLEKAYPDVLLRFPLPNSEAAWDRMILSRSSRK